MQRGRLEQAEPLQELAGRTGAFLTFKGKMTVATYKIINISDPNTFQHLLLHCAGDVIRLTFGDL